MIYFLYHLYTKIRNPNDIKTNDFAFLCQKLIKLKQQRHQNNKTNDYETF